MKNTQLEHKHHQASKKKYPICFLAHDFDVPMNVGSLFRIADALGVERIYLSGTTPAPPNSKIRKTSRSTEKVVPYTYEKNPAEIIKRLKMDGYKIISLELTTASVDLLEMPSADNEKICLIIGSEKRGVHQELLNLSDLTIHIKMLGHHSSMNVANACSIATFEMMRRFYHGREADD